MPDIQEDGPVIFADVETRLKIPPDIICDLVLLPIRDGCIDSIVADPPYWNFGSSRLHGDPGEAHGTWWGNFKNLRILRRILVGIVKSSRRVLRPGGRLYLKWCDVVHPWTRWSPMFSWDFALDDKITRTSKSGRNSKPCYWFTFSLKPLCTYSRYA